MKVALLGRVSATDSYVSKSTQEVIKSVSVAAGKHMISVRVDANVEFREDDRVLVHCELIPNNRDFYCKDASIHLATRSDIAFFNVLDTSKSHSFEVSDILSGDNDV